jgi:ubiquinone biosynthesis protein
VSAAWELPGSPTVRRGAIYGTAARVAARYGRARLPLSPGVQHAHQAGARDIYRTAVRLRGGFLKFGQFVSARPDLLPPAYVDELSKLQDRVPAAPASVMTAVVASDVGPVNDLFTEFDEAASAASLAQVHRAVRRDGRAVAVKVQYPEVASIVPREAGDTRRIMNLAGRVVQGLDLSTIGAVLEQTILSELDYEREAANIERFAENFATETTIDVPRVHRDLSHGRVLVMDWIEGENLARALAGAEQPLAEEAARILVDSYLKQILIDGFLHADPHPGNFLLQPGPRLGVVDFGACAELSESTRLAMRSLYAAGVRNDLGGAVEALDALGFKTRSGSLDALVQWASLFAFEDTGENMEAAWAKLMAAHRADPLVRIPSELIMVGRVLIVQTGLIARIRPSWRMDDLIEARLASPDT